MSEAMDNLAIDYLLIACMGGFTVMLGVGAAMLHDALSFYWRSSKKRALRH